MMPKRNRRSKRRTSDALEFVEDVIRWSKRSCKQRSRRRKIVLYAEGLRDKLRQAQFAIDSMRNLLPSLSSEADPSSGDKDFSGLDRVYFYLDAFWAFSYASLDIAAQIVNQSDGLPLDERNVSFKAVCGSLNPRSSVRLEMQRIQGKNYFRSLEKYRHCCLHRRTVCIKEEINRVRYTAGYTRVEPQGVLQEDRTSMKRGARTQVMEITSKIILCDDPLAPTPRWEQNREMVGYCSKSFQHLCSALEGLFAVVAASSRP